MIQGAVFVLFAMAARLDDDEEEEEEDEEGEDEERDRFLDDLSLGLRRDFERDELTRKCRTMSSQDQPRKEDPRMRADDRLSVSERHSLSNERDNLAYGGCSTNDSVDDEGADSASLLGANDKTLSASRTAADDDGGSSSDDDGGGGSGDDVVFLGPLLLVDGTFLIPQRLRIATRAAKKRTRLWKTRRSGPRREKDCCPERCCPFKPEGAPLLTLLQKKE